MSALKINLLGLSRKQMEQFVVECLGEKAFRATQIIKWIHQMGVTDFDEMSNLSKKTRTLMAEIAEITPPEITEGKLSADGTYKWITRLRDGQRVETVYIPESGRGTLCVSSQVGCALDCSFCSTAKQGFNRNLSSDEIIGQVWLAAKHLGFERLTKERRLTNVVMMGMGEPLANYDNVVHAMDLMMDDFAYMISRRRVTLSTSGVVPGIYRLAEDSNVALAISLHAPNDAIRDQLVPINKKYPLAQLLPAIQNYLDKANPTDKITMEYVMIDGVNDQAVHAHELVQLLKNLPSKINLIPFNPFPNTEYGRSKSKTIEIFQDILTKAGFTVTVRKTRGDDIDAACGQLVGQVTDRTKRTLAVNEIVRQAV